MSSTTRQTDGLLKAHGAGDSSALDQVFSRVYRELRRHAHWERLRVGGRETLRTTDLVHEVYLKLAASDGMVGVDRAHFMLIASQAMRQVLVDYARRQSRKKRGGDRERTARQPDELARDDETEYLLAVNDAVDKLAEVDPRLVRIVECRYFTGLSSHETAEATGLSLRTVQRGWKAARAFLHQELVAHGVPTGGI